jgi:Zn-dependent protease with chaperone function/uncharacterized tellurite resistance protein B-like protein
MKNFFEHQAEAQRRTHWLLLGMAGAVFGMGALLFVLLWLLLHATLSSSATTDSPQLESQLFWSCVLGTGAVVVMASLWRTVSLRTGGAGIAEMLGGRLISGQPRDALERRLLNVVEEMSIAAGAPVPRVFVLDAEPGINALAAGWQLHDATIAVTHGCLEKLTRAELQGVIGHELSHVLHGDMRLNVRLMGTVFGILFISLLGRHTMRAANLSRRHGAPVLVLGLGMVGVGALGALCANLIKAAVSRQREFLADASAVQFTRDPSSIASALKKIGGHAAGARLNSRNAEEASHFFFGDIQRHVLRSSPLATHPPLVERIRRLDPSFTGTFPELRDPDVQAELEPVSGSMMAEAAASSMQPRASIGTAASVGVSATSRNPSPPAALVLRLVGTANITAIKASQAWLEQIPLPLREAAQNPYSACALLYAALLSDDAAVRQRQALSIETLSSTELRQETERLAPLVQPMARADRLLLTDLSSPALQSLAAGQRAAFSRTVQALVDADATVSIFEYVVANLLVEQTRARATQARAQRLTSWPREVELLVSLLAHAGDLDGNGAASAFAQAALRLRGLAISLLPSSARLVSGLGPALDALRSLHPTDSAQLIDACAQAVLADQRATDAELTLLRAVCLSLGVPIPLLG